MILFFRKSQRYKKKYDDYESEFGYLDIEHEDKPIVNKIILPTKLWLKALDIGRQTPNEVGFYIVGLFRGKTCYIYDLIEFDYTEQSGAFIKSGLKKIARIRAGLPAGLDIVGNMHKHPGFLGYSGTDKKDYLLYGKGSSQNAFIIYIVEPYDGIAGYTATENNIYEVEVEIRELEPYEQLIEKKISLKIDLKLVAQKSENVKGLKYRFLDQIGHELLKLFSRSDFEIDNIPIPYDLKLDQIPKKLDIPPRYPVYLKNVGLNEDILIRIFLDQDDTLYKLRDILLDLIKIDESEITKLRFVENDKILPNYTKVSKIKTPLEWKIIEEHKKINLIFFKNLFDLILDILITDTFGWYI